MFEPIFITITDKNVAYDNVNNDIESNLLNNDGKKMFLTNIKYIFDDDDPLLINEETNIGFDHANDRDIDNVFMVNMHSLTNIDNIELISDKFKLLNYNLWSKEEKNIDFDNLDLEIDVISQFQDLTKKSDELTLNELIDLYRIQNEQIKSMMNNI